MQLKQSITKQLWTITNSNQTNTIMHDSFVVLNVHN